MAAPKQLKLQQPNALVSAVISVTGPVAWAIRLSSDDKAPFSMKSSQAKGQIKFTYQLGNSTDLELDEFQWIIRALNYGSKAKFKFELEWFQGSKLLGNITDSVELDKNQNDVFDGSAIFL